MQSWAAPGIRHAVAHQAKLKRDLGLHNTVGTYKKTFYKSKSCVFVVIFVKNHKMYENVQFVNGEIGWLEFWASRVPTNNTLLGVDFFKHDKHLFMVVMIHKPHIPTVIYKKITTC